MTFPITHKATEWMSLVESAIRHLGPCGAEVRYRDVVSHIETLPGFPGWDHWGMRPHKGGQQPKALRAVTLAAGKLKDAGVIRQPRRGYYAVYKDTLMPVTATPAPKAPVAAPKAPKAPNVVVKDGVAFTPRSGAVTDTAYAADAALARVAAEQTRCFGAWSVRSDQCGGCPLAGMCQQAGMADFAEVAALLDAETEAEIARAQAPAAPVATEPEIKGVRTTVPFNVACSHCGEQIPAGGDARHIDGYGVFHPACTAHVQA